MDDPDVFTSACATHQPLELSNDEIVHLQFIVEASDGSELGPIINGITFFMPNALEKHEVPLRLLSSKPYIVLLISGTGQRPRPCIGGFLSSGRYLRLAKQVPNFCYYWPRFTTSHFIRNYRIIATAEDYYTAAVQRAQLYPENAYNDVIIPLVTSFRLCSKQRNNILEQARTLIHSWDHAF